MRITATIIIQSKCGSLYILHVLCTAVPKWYREQSRFIQINKLFTLKSSSMHSEACIGLTLRNVLELQCCSQNRKFSSFTDFPLCSIQNASVAYEFGLCSQYVCMYLSFYILQQRILLPGKKELIEEGITCEDHYLRRKHNSDNNSGTMVCSLKTLQWLVFGPIMAKLAIIGFTPHISGYIRIISYLFPEWLPLINSFACMLNFTIAWFLISLTLHPLSWYSLVHCIGTSYWLLLPIGNSTLDHWIWTITNGSSVIPKRQPFHIESDFIGLYNWSLIKINIKPCTQNPITTFRLIHTPVAFANWFYE